MATGMTFVTARGPRALQLSLTRGPKNAQSPSRSVVGTAGQRPTVRCAASSEDEEPERIKGIFEFVIDNESSRNAIQLEATPAQDGNLGQMISAIKGKGRDFGSYIDVGEYQWFVRELGPKAGPTIVFLHGAPLQSWSYKDVLQQLSARGYHCLAIDWIGFGFSEKPQPGYYFEYTEEAYHKQLSLLLEALDVPPTFSLVAHGFLTGSYALTWALSNPSRLSSLTVLNSPLTPATSLPSELQQLRFPFIGEFACQNAILAERFIEKGSPYELDNDDADVYRMPYLASGDPGFALLEVARKFKLPDVPRRIQEGLAASSWTVPTLLAWGKQDPFLQMQVAADVAASRADVIKFKEVDGAGHLPQEDWPEKVVDAMLSVIPGV